MSKPTCPGCMFCVDYYDPGEPGLKEWPWLALCIHPACPEGEWGPFDRRGVHHDIGWTMPRTPEDSPGRECFMDLTPIYP